MMEMVEKEIISKEKKGFGSLHKTTRAKPIQEGYN